MLKWLMLCINIIGVMAVVYYFLLQPIAPKKKALQPPPEFSLPISPARRMRCAILRASPR